jgi:hypothetical protein
VDNCAYYKIQKGYSQPTLKSLDDLLKVAPKPYDPYHYPSQNGRDDEEQFVDLADEHCFLANPYVRGFALQTKLWCELMMDGFVVPSDVGANVM